MSTVATPDEPQVQQATTREELLASVERIRPVLEANADEAERIRTLPEPAWRALHDEGLFLIKAPKVLGGSETDPETQIDVIEAVSRIDTSAGWTLMIGAGTLGLVTPSLNDAGIAAFMSKGRLPRFAGVGMPGGSATPVPGGYRVTGRWPFASGSRHAEWVGGNAFIVDSDPPQIRNMVFPVDDVVLHDNWYVGGLKGTGSGDFSVEDVFVAEDLTFSLLDGPQYRGGPLYRIKGAGAPASEHGAFALGAARRALEEMRELAKSKRRGLTQQGVAGRGVFQFDLGYCEQALNAARANLVTAYRRAWDFVVDTDGPTTPEIEIELRAAAAYATDVAMEVCQRMFRHAGGKSLYSGNIIERCTRDVHAGAQHIMVSQATYELRGQALLGFENLLSLA